MQCTTYTLHHFIWVPSVLSVQMCVSKILMTQQKNFLLTPPQCNAPHFHKYNSQVSEISVYCSLWINYWVCIIKGVVNELFYWCLCDAPLNFVTAVKEEQTPILQNRLKLCPSGAVSIPFQLGTQKRVCEVYANLNRRALPRVPTAIVNNID